MPPKSSSDSVRAPEVTLSPHSKPTKKKAGRESPLTDKQQEVVESYFPAWEQLLRTHKLHFGKEKDSKARDPQALTSWVDETVKKIRKTNGFLTDDDVKTKNEWEKVLSFLFDRDSLTPVLHTDPEGHIQKLPAQCVYQEKHQQSCEKRTRN